MVFGCKVLCTHINGLILCLEFVLFLFHVIFHSDSLCYNRSLLGHGIADSLPKGAVESSIEMKESTIQLDTPPKSNMDPNK